MHLCVAGGTGQTGREVVAQALLQGHQVSVISRHPPSSGSSAQHSSGQPDSGRPDGVTYFTGDVTTGAGLEAALSGVDVLIDCLEGKAGKALRTFADGGTRLLAAAAAQDVPKAVLLSIINCDQSSSAFYRSKAAKEAVYAASGLDTAVLRATQFHSLLDMIFAAGRPLRLVPVFKGTRFQPIAPAEVATLLLAEALAGPGPGPGPGKGLDADAVPGGHRVITAGGPEVAGMRDLAVTWQKITGAPGRIMEFPLPGAMGRYLRSGLNLAPDRRAGEQAFEAWLTTRLAKREEYL